MNESFIIIIIITNLPRCWSTSRTILHSIDCETQLIVDRENLSFLATNLRHNWAIPMEHAAEWSHRRDTQHFNLQDQTQNIFIQTVFHGRMERHKRLCDGLVIKKRYTNVLYITCPIHLLLKVQLFFHTKLWLDVSPLLSPSTVCISLNMLIQVPLSHTKQFHTHSLYIYLNAPAPTFFSFLPPPYICKLD